MAEERHSQIQSPSRSRSAVTLINRPEKRNALNGATFCKAWTTRSRASRHDKSIRAMVLRRRRRGLFLGSRFAPSRAGRVGSGGRWAVSPQDIFRRLEQLPDSDYRRRTGRALTGGLGAGAATAICGSRRKTRVGMTPARIGPTVPDYFVFRKFMALVGTGAYRRRSCSPPRRSCASVRMRSAWSIAWWLTSRLGTESRERWPRTDSRQRAALVARDEGLDPALPERHLQRRAQGHRRDAHRGAA